MNQQHRVLPPNANEPRTAVNTFTLFGVPKPFVGDAERIQRNATKSWRRLQDLGFDVDVVLLGDETGIRESAMELDVHHISGLKLNQRGTPLLSSAFQLVREYSESPVLIYVNSDVLLLEDFIQALLKLRESPLSSYLAIGQRTDVQLDREFDFEVDSEIQKIREIAGSHGQLSARVCKEYFAFTRDLFSEMPNFAVGRGNWDNWMVANTRQRNIPVVNISQCGTALHQMHDYGHSGSNRMEVLCDRRRSPRERTARRW